AGQRQRRDKMIRGQPDQNQVLHSETPNDDALRRGCELISDRHNPGVRSDLRRAFENGLPQSFDLISRKHGETGLGASGYASLDLRVDNVEDSMQHALFDPYLLNAFERDAALFAFEDALLSDQLVAFDAIGERKVSRERRHDRARNDRHQQKESVNLIAEK